LRRDARISRNWPTVKGRILERGIQSMQTDGRSFTPRVKYSYTVAGTEYLGETVYRTGNVGSLKDSARRLTDALPEAIPVHYNPQEPSEAYLLANPVWYYWLILIFGTGILLWGLLQLLTMLVD
jgi:hypothetical protein